MNLQRENVSLWLKRSEPDYYSMFLGAWIPLNAWYVLEYPQHKKKDTLIIKELQEDNNSKPRRIIENLLEESKDIKKLRFQSSVAELVYYLEETPVYHNGSKLSFKEIPLSENPVKFRNEVDKKNNILKVERKSSYFQAYIQQKGGKVLLDFKKPEFNVEDLIKDNDYLRLESKLQQRIRSLFIEIDPNKTFSLISKERSKNNYIKLVSEHSCKLINDRTLIAKSMIFVLYSLRCMLFHGEISPNQSNMNIYENAYNILHCIIRDFK